jgi:hypothetical protein
VAYPLSDAQGVCEWNSPGYEGGAVMPTSTALAVQPKLVKFEKSKIILAFQDLTKIQDVDALTDKDLFANLQIGFRIDSQVIGPLCASFLRRFKAAKKEKKDFHGFKNLTRACPVLTGYSSQQVRNLAAGTPTPIKKATFKPLSAAEKFARNEARKLQDQVDLASARAVASRNLSNAESHAAQTETPSAVVVLPVVPFSQKDVSELKERRAKAASDRLEMDDSAKKSEKRIQTLSEAFAEMKNEAIHLATLGTQAVATDEKILAAVRKLSAKFLAKHGGAE